MVSQSTSKLSPRTCSRAVFTTPGPLTLTLMIASASVTPWNAPAMKGLSSGALQNTTSFAQPRESCSLVYSLQPVLRSCPSDAPHPYWYRSLWTQGLRNCRHASVRQSAIGIEWISISSAFCHALRSDCTDCFCSTVHCICDRCKIFRCFTCCTADQCDRCNWDSFIDNWDSVFSSRSPPTFADLWQLMWYGYKCSHLIFSNHPSMHESRLIPIVMVRTSKVLMFHHVIGFFTSKMLIIPVFPL